MTTYNAAIQPKSSNTAGVEPLPSELIVGELALNTEDGKLFTKNSAEEIVTIVGGGGGGAVDSVNGETGVVSLSLDNLSDVIDITPPADGQVLTWVEANSQWEFTDAANAVDSVNGETGVVSLGIQDMDDVDTSTTPPTDGQVLAWVDSNNQWEPKTVGVAVDYDQDPAYGRFNWTWDADYTSSIYPGDGVAWPGTYPVNYIWFTTIDNGGIDCQSELYALTGSDNLKLYRNNSLIYEGAAAFFANKSNGRITLSFGADVDNSTFSSGDIIGLESDTWVGDATTLGTGQILQYDATAQAWTPIVPDFVRAVNGQKVNATIGVADLSGLGSDPERPSYVWIYSNTDSANPSAGRVTDYTPYGTSSFFVNTTDENGVDLQTELYASFSNMKIKIWVNGELFYDGISSRSLTQSSNRVDFQMVGADITSWVDGDVIGFWTELLPGPASLPDKTIVYYAEEKSSWAYGKSPLGIQDASDYQEREESGQITLKRVAEDDLEDTGVKGGWSIFGSGNQFYYSQFDTDITNNLSNGDSITMEVPGMASPFATTLTNDPQQAGTSRKYFFNISPSAPAEIIDTSNGTNLIIKSVNLTTNPSIPLNGDVLQWVEADEKFVPTQLPDAVATRALLGIGEYVDDAAAGTGGVASGAMYYNTTTSDYRQKT